MDYSIDDRSEEEKAYDRKHPLISLNSGQQKDFVKALYIKLKLNYAKKLIYDLKERAKKQNLTIANQAEEIQRLTTALKEAKKYSNKRRR